MSLYIHFKGESERRVPREPLLREGGKGHTKEGDTLPGIAATQFTMSRIGHYLVMIIGFVVAFQFIGIDLSGLAVIVGLLSVGIGCRTEGDVVAIHMRFTAIQSPKLERSTSGSGVFKA